MQNISWTQIPTSYFCSGQESTSEPISGNVNEPLFHFKHMFNDNYILCLPWLGECLPPGSTRWGRGRAGGREGRTRYGETSGPAPSTAPVPPSRCTDPQPPRSSGIYPEGNKGTFPYSKIITDASITQNSACRGQSLVTKLVIVIAILATYSQIGSHPLDVFLAVLTLMSVSTHFTVYEGPMESVLTLMSMVSSEKGNRVCTHLDVYDVIWEGPIGSVDADELVLPEAVDFRVPEDADCTELRHRLAQVVVLFHPVQREPHVKLQVVVVQSETVLTCVFARFRATLNEMAHMAQENILVVMHTIHLPTVRVTVAPLDVGTN